MSRQISFTIPIIPTAQMRVRHFSKKTRSGKVFSGAYKHPEQARNEEQLMQLLAQYVPEKPLTGSIYLTVYAYLPIPQSKPTWWQEAAHGGLIVPVTKPDIDNLFKNITDCMTKLSFWNDDSQITRMISRKFYSNKPRWEVYVISEKQLATKKEYDELLRFRDLKELSV